LLLLDASEKGIPLYEKYAFWDHGSVVGYAIAPRPADREGREEDIDVQPIGAGMEVEIVAFDAACYGADRTSLVRYLLGAYAGRGFVARDRSGAVIGYAIGQAHSLGPCMARSSAVARALVCRTLTLPFEGHVGWFVGANNREAIDLAGALHAVPGRTWRHMRRGRADALASNWSQLFAKASLAVG
jgi:hypothetical protein